ncbi:nitroreductase family deazaflavin-dependent oxidoreductase [Streptomyces phaeochromogenes]|uniref:nitroreductase family deazaflavin-dependent oxidoreductase n=1 Tax=Streptomyces phaeochromogenes TaxID=1923 RepID=UPI0033D825E0
MTEPMDFNEMNEKVVAEFRDNGGKVGGAFAGTPLVLVHHVGAKSGVERITPLAYFAEGGRIFVFATKGGADDNPAWYHNLLANPRATVELGTETFEVVALPLSGAERDEYFAKQVAVAPHFAEYERMATRVIPVVELRRVD